MSCQVSKHPDVSNTGYGIADWLIENIKLVTKVDSRIWGAESMRQPSLRSLRKMSVQVVDAEEGGDDDGDRRSASDQIFTRFYEPS
jgi:hypothetical protein